MFISSIFFYFLLTSIYAEKTLKYAAVVFRQSDITPVHPYPTDPRKKESVRPVIFGESTNMGKEQHYFLGKWVKPYTNLISKQYDPTEVYVRSTDVDQTLMSAQDNSAGLYPPTGKSYSKEKERFERSSAYKERLIKYNGLMDYLTAYTGKKFNNYTINDIYNVLFIESLYNLTLPSWTESVYPNKIREPARYRFSTAAATPLMARLLVGQLLKEIITTMNNVINSTDDDFIRLSIYSGHDYTIGNILNALGVFDENCPAYTTTILFELLEDAMTNQHFIQIYYKNSAKLVQPKSLVIRHCGKICPYKRFVDLYDNFITIDWTRDCNKKMSLIFSVVYFLSVLTILYLAKKAHLERIANQHRVRVPYTNFMYPHVQQEQFSYL